MKPRSFQTMTAEVVNETTQFPNNDSRGGDGQQTRKCRGLAVCRQEERQHRHDKNAKAEARGSLHKAGSDAQYEYGNDKATHQNFPNTSITLTQSVSGSKPNLSSIPTLK